MAVPEDVEAFLRDRVETFEQLESLLLLASDRGRNWSIADVAALAKMRPGAVGTALEELSSMGLAESYAEEGLSYYRLAALPPVTEQTLERLRRAYEEQTVDVMKLMSKNAMERLRTSAIRTFAEAFVLRKKKDG